MHDVLNNIQKIMEAGGKLSIQLVGPTVKLVLDWHIDDEPHSSCVFYDTLSDLQHATEGSPSLFETLLKVIERSKQEVLI